MKKARVILEIEYDEEAQWISSDGMVTEDLEGLFIDIIYDVDDVKLEYVEAEV